MSEPGRLLRIDPATDRVTDRVPLRLPNGDPLSVFDVQMLGGVPWVIGAEGAMRINAADGHVEQFTRLRGLLEPFFVIASEDSLWVVHRQQRLLRYDLATGRREGDWPIPPIPDVTGVTPTRAGPVYATHTVHGPVEGLIAGHDPFDSIKHALEDGEFDDVIISTLPARTSEWLRRDLPRRVERLGVPVTVITAADDPREGALIRAGLIAGA